MYEYRAEVIRVVDGDTAWLEVSLGLDQYAHHSIRFAGINAPEMHTDAGKAAKAYLLTHLKEGEVITLNTIKDKTEKYGRYLGILITDAGMNINDEMVRSGHAVPYMA